MTPRIRSTRAEGGLIWPAGDDDTSLPAPAYGRGRGSKNFDHLSSCAAASRAVAGGSTEHAGSERALIPLHAYACSSLCKGLQTQQANASSSVLLVLMKYPLLFQPSAPIFITPFTQTIPDRSPTSKNKVHALCYVTY